MRRHADQTADGIGRRRRHQDALKAEIRFYNLASGCAQGRLAMADKGAVVFPDVAAGSSSARGINPVKARLVAGCGGKDSAPLALPALQPGDHYSLFLTGTAAPRCCRAS